MEKSTVLIEPADGVGAYIKNIDLRTTPSKADTQALREALGEYGVLYFRDQDLTPEKHIDFAECFGKININRFFKAVDEHPKIAEVLKEPDHKKNIGGQWHTDHTYDTEPALGSILLARETPARGGNTLFANMYSAYEALSDGMKRTLESLNAVHSSRHQFGANYSNDREGRIGNAKAATQDAVHPVVISHPISGKKCLYVNGGFTLHFEGWTKAESEPLLEQLYVHATQPEFTHRFQWAPGSIVFWDNRATQHYALNDYHGERRLMHRITVEGEALHA